MIETTDTTTGCTGKKQDISYLPESKMAPISDEPPNKTCLPMENAFNKI
jgi:hypothetical protein